MGWILKGETMAYGDRRDFRKINIYVNGVYKASTTWARTCREAAERYSDSVSEIRREPMQEKVTARFDRSY